MHIRQLNLYMSIFACEIWLSDKSVDTKEIADEIEVRA